MIAEYLYHDGQIEAADVMCKVRVLLVLTVLVLLYTQCINNMNRNSFIQEAKVELDPAYRECFVELHRILKALKGHDMQPALE